MTDKEAENELKEWIESRPQCIKDLVQKLPIFNDYVVNKTGQTCRILSYFENGTVKVIITGMKKGVLPHNIGWQVFGLKPTDLTIIY